MSEENNRLTLGEVTRDDLTIQPDVPQDDLTRYFEETDLPTIMEDFRKNGTEPESAYRILAKRGYNPEQVEEEMALHYEEQRQLHIADQQRRSEEENRIEALSAQSERATPASPELDKQVKELELSTTDEDTGEITSIAIPQYAKIMQESGALDDPLTPIALPKDIDNAMMRGEDVELRYQSYQSDKDMYDVYSQHQLAGELYRAFQDKDVSKYNAISRELTEQGMYAPEVQSLDDDLSDVQMNIFGNIEENKRKQIEERNRINAQFGLPSSFNPDSDVDFRQAMRESLVRQSIDFESSDYGGYVREVEDLAEEMLERSDKLDNYILGDDHGAAIEGALQGLSKKYVLPIIESATVGLPNMYYDGMEALGMGSENDFRKGRAKIKAKMQASRKLNDAIAQERKMRLMQRGLSDQEASLGMSELFQSMVRGEVTPSAFLNRTSYEAAEGFGQALGWMAPIGRVAKLMSGAKATAKATAKAAAGRSVPKGVGILTAEQASAARAIDAASEAAKALSRANIQYQSTFAALGLNSAGLFYKDLYDRKDLTFAEKMLQSSMVGVAEATLGKIFSNVDAAFFGGARKTAQAATLSELKQMSKQQLKELTRRSGLKKAAKATSKGLSEEFAEEFGVELVGQSVSIINDLVMGRKPQEINWNALVDSGLAGMFGAGPTSVMSGLGTYMAHHSMLNERNNIVEAIGDLDAELANATSKEERQRIQAARDLASFQLMKIDGDSKRAFSKMSQGARRQLLKIHRDLAYTGNKLKDPNLTKEEKQQLTARYESLIAAKQRLEKEEPTFESSVDDSEVIFTDAKGEEQTVTTESVTEDETRRIESAEKSDEFAPENQKQEEEELSRSEEDLVEEDTPEPAEEPAQQARAEEGLDAEEIDIAQALDVTDPEQVGEDGRMTVDQALATNALIKGYGKKLSDQGVKILRHRSQASLKKAGKAENQDSDIGGFFDPETNTIHLAPDATAREIQEEFAHAVFRDILGENAAGRQNLFEYLDELAETNTGVEAAIAKARRQYADAPEAEQQEEAIVEVLLGYAEGSIDLNRNQRKGIIKLINDIFSFVAGGDVSDVQIKNDAEFRRFAESFKRATRGEQDVEVARPDVTESPEARRNRLEREADALLADAEGVTTSEEDALTRGTEDISTMRMSRREGKKEFTYLNDTTIFFEEDAFANAGEVAVAERYRSRKVFVKNYNYFRRWYNRITANGARDMRVKNMVFYGEDGRVHKVRPPRPYPSTDSRSSDAALTGKQAASKRFYDRQAQKAKATNEARNAWLNEFSPEADRILSNIGMPGTSGYVFIPGFPFDTYESVKGDRAARGQAMFEWAEKNLFNKTPEQQMEMLDVAQQNLVALQNTGMSVDEVNEFLKKDPAAAFNMTGLVPAHMASSGDSTNQSRLRFSRRDAKPTSPRVTGMARKRGGVIGKLQDFQGVIARNIGYDVSKEGIGSGLMNQFNQRFNFGGRLIPILSSHIDAKYAASTLRSIKEMAEEDLARPESERKGFVMLTFSTLEIDSLGGNPQVFQDLVNRVVEKGENPVDVVNEILQPVAEGGVLNNALYRKLSRSKMILDNPSLSDKFVQSDLMGTRSQVETEAEAQAVIDALLEVRSEEGGFDTNFDTRSLVAKKLVDKVKSSGQTRAEYLASEFADNSLVDTRMGGAVMAGVRVPYRITEDGKVDLSHIKVRTLSQGDVSKVVGRGKARGPFDGFLVNTMEPGEVPNKHYGREFTEEDGKMIVFEEQVPLGEAYPSATKFNETTKQYERRFDEDPDKRLTQEKGAAARGVSAVLLDDRTVDHRVEEKNQKAASNRQSRRGEAFTMSEETGFQKWKNKWIRRLQDKFNDIFIIQRAIESQRGKLGKDKDFQMAEELMYGKAAEDLAKLDARVEEITAMMKKAGIKVDELSDYLYALHAKERNAVIEERTKGKIKDGSGMTNAEADAIINSTNKTAIDPIVKEIRAIQADTRKTMVKFGLETQETVDAFESMFENYVPLAGVATDELTGSPYPTGGAGMNTFGPATRRAKGRQSKADNILAQIVAQNAGIHIKARTNEAMNTLYNLVNDNPNPKVWRVLDESSVTDPLDNRLVAVRVNGRQKFIYFNDPSYAESLRGMNLPQSNAFIRALRAPAQWLRASFTTLNPEFVISNFSRDIQSALFNASAEAEIEGGMLNSAKTVKRIFALVPQTLKTLTKNAVQRGGDPAIEKYFAEFKEDGGKTGWAYAKPLDQIASELSGDAEGKTKTQEILGKAKNFAEFIEGINDAFENSIRLASYIAARENGVSREKAAQLAKNITVNFNKQGEWGPTLNAVYLFFNASVQGTARLGRSLVNLRPQKRPDGTNRKNYERITSAQWMASGLALFSSMLTMLGYAMSDEDEDGTPFWDKIPDYVKERNLVIMRPNGKDYFKIPMPYGFNVFANMGTATTEAAYGGREADEAMMFLFNSFMASFSPVSFGQSEDLFKSVGKGAVPTVMKPFVDVMVNETYFGSPVTGENLPFGVQRPESELSFRSPEGIQDFFKWMNEATGGSEYKAGGMDFNPDKFWYMFEYYIGGAGQFVNRSLFKFPKQIQAKLFSDEDIQVQAGDVPLARILYGQPSKYFDMEKFKDNEQEFKALYKEAKESPRRDDLERYKGISTNMNSVLNKVKKQMKLLRKAQYEARKIEDYAQKTARIQELKNKERRLIMQWNKYYEQARN